MHATIVWIALAPLEIPSSLSWDPATFLSTDTLRYLARWTIGMRAPSEIALRRRIAVYVRPLIADAFHKIMDATKPSTLKLHFAELLSFP